MKKNLTNEQKLVLWESVPEEQWEYLDGTMVITLKIPVRPDLSPTEAKLEWERDVMVKINEIMQEGKFDPIKDGPGFITFLVSLGRTIRGAFVTVNEAGKAN